MSRNRSLLAANKAKYDEFYTQLTDIEEELKHYRKSFRDKTIYCNCDDPTISNFSKYFSLNFEKFGLKRLITTSYKNVEPDLFSIHDNESAVGFNYTGNEPKPTIFHLNGDGDFRSQECIELLKQADIVVTNPPFSLFREYVAQLIEYDKKFLILGNANAVTYKEVFPLIKSGKLWLGNKAFGRGGMLFDVPEDYARSLERNKKEGFAYKIVDGIFKAISHALWFTNIDYKKRYEDIILYKEYSPQEYPKYDQYDAINVDRVCDIPKDYSGEMGVPITFLDKHNPDQFDIVAMTAFGKLGVFQVHGKNKYRRIIVRNRRLQK